MAVEQALQNQHATDTARGFRPEVESLRLRAHLLKSRLDALEEEATRLQCTEPGRSALEAQRQTRMLAERCETKQAVLRSWPKATIQRIVDKYDERYEELFSRYVELDQVCE